MDIHKDSFILLFQCLDRKGIVARISEFILAHDGNIISADQYTTDPQEGNFFMRVEFSSDRSRWNKSSLAQDLQAIAGEFKADYRIFDSHDIPRMGILVSKPDHCLFELLYLWKSGELRVEIPFVASNFEGHRQLVASYGIPFHFAYATNADRKEEELLAIAQQSDFLVLARYMMVLSPKFLTDYGRDIINIHHGFLPSFKGANPYKQAFDGGVKVIGATAHFVNEKLDEGPIISQAVEHVSHRDDVDSLIRKGKNLEKHALAQAVSLYINHRIIRHNNKTIVFEET